MRFAIFRIKQNSFEIFQNSKISIRKFTFTRFALTIATVLFGFLLMVFWSSPLNASDVKVTGGVTVIARYHHHHHRDRRRRCWSHKQTPKPSRRPTKSSSTIPCNHWAICLWLIQLLRADVGSDVIVARDVDVYSNT